GILALLEAPVDAVPDAAAERGERAAPRALAAELDFAAAARPDRGLVATTQPDLLAHDRHPARVRDRGDDRLPELHGPRGPGPRLLLHDGLSHLRDLDRARLHLADRLDPRFVQPGHAAARGHRARRGRAAGPAVPGDAHAVVHARSARQLRGA